MSEDHRRRITFRERATTAALAVLAHAALWIVQRAVDRADAASRPPREPDRR